MLSVERHSAVADRMPAVGHPGGHPAGIPEHPGHPGPHGHGAGHLGAHGHGAGHPSQGDNSSSAHRSYRPGAGPAAKAYEERTGIKAPRIIAWEITRRCNLLCEHCRASAEECAYPGELTLDECKAVIDDIASITDPILILTGGEPLMRSDIWDIIDYAHEAGLHPVIGTNGTLITEDIARKIAEHGIPRVSISLDFPTPAEQDRFRGKQGAFDDAVAGIEALNAQGVGVQVNTTITKMNVDMVDQVHELANSLGAVAFHPFLLVPTGRGEDLIDVELTPEEYEEVLTWAYNKQQCSPMHFKPTDSPQYYRIIRQQAAREGREVTAETYGMEALTRGCLGGITFCFISHVGDVQPCGYFDMQLGNVKEQPFSTIWTESPVFDDLRHYDRLKGKCGVCEYKGVCGGCRARALAVHGDYMEEEPYCSYVPRKVVQDRVLDVIQTDFPLHADPYACIAERVGTTKESVVDAISTLKDKGIIRRIGASVAASGVGYLSCLCAIAVDPENREEAGRVVAEYPHVTHDYARHIDKDLSCGMDDDTARAIADDRFNVWFTVTARGRERVDQVVDEIRAKTQASEALVLPSLSTYKIRVSFDSGSGLGGADARTCSSEVEPVPFDCSSSFDVELIRWAQGDVATFASDGSAEEPFDCAAQLLSGKVGRDVSADEVVERLAQLKAAKAIRRFGAIVRHNKMGYAANAMVVFRVDDEKADQVGKALAAFPFVSHCYRRPSTASWPFDVYAMIHAHSSEELLGYIGELRAAAGTLCDNPSMAILRSGQEFKKTSMRYFEDDEEAS